MINFAALSRPVPSFTQLQVWMEEAGADAATATTMAAIGMAEGATSNPYGINPDSYGTQSAGIWQINSANWATLAHAGIITSPLDLTNPITNARAALYILHDQGLNAWTTWKQYATGQNTPAAATIAQYLSGSALPQMHANTPGPTGALFNGSSAAAPADWSPELKILAVAIIVLFLIFSASGAKK